MDATSDVSIRFDATDADLFRLASGDRNPLHLDDDYARRTPFGVPVVFGMLGVITCLGRRRAGRSRRLRSIIANFRAPIFNGTDYRLERTLDTAERFEARIADGRRAVLDVTAAFETRPSCAQAPERVIGPSLPRTVARRCQLSDLSRGHSVRDRYAPSWTHAQALSERTGLARAGIDVTDAAALLLLSYVVGMEIPGESALFSTFRLDLDAQRGATGEPFEFEAAPQSVDSRIGRVTAEVGVTVSGRPFGAGEVAAYLREEIPPVDANELRAGLPREPRLTGRRAFVVGGSRGLGACLVHALSLSGCDVAFAYERSDDAANTVVRAAPGPGSVVAFRGDASDHAWCRETIERIIGPDGGLDLLICNAAPSFGSLDVHPETIDRLLGHVSKSLELTAIPMATCLDALAARGGTAAVISSSAVTTAPADWPHYVSAKRAIEGFVEVTARQRRDVGFLVVRPPKLFTDLVNTPLGRLGAIAPELAAATTVARLSEDRRPERQVGILEEFDRATHEADPDGSAVARVGATPP